jgi:hypothetical protein
MNLPDKLKFDTLPVHEHGGFLYDSDTYNDELPYYVNVADEPHPVVRPPWRLPRSAVLWGSVATFSGGDPDFLQSCVGCTITLAIAHRGSDAAQERWVSPVAEPAQEDGRGRFHT